jgi:7,8-dihydropterin-6-yl-methyl-4-(beta-D-ribofuranosyl)aminobenzene 5'-phosphate synthase
MQYSDNVLEHFINPRNAGEITDADGVGTIGSEECGDMIRVWIKVSDDNHLKDIKYRVFGCPAAIACCSMMTELAMGKHLNDASILTDEQVANALGGLPAYKFHCSNLAASALHEAIMNYNLKSSIQTETVTAAILLNNSAAENLKSEHGLSIWIEFGEKRVLFDTGQSDVLLENAKLLGINLKNTDAIVMSHGHYDHTGGLKAVLDIAGKAVLYIHPEALKLRYSQKEKTARMIGMPDSAKQTVRKMADAGRVVWTEMPTEVLPGLFVTSRIPRNTDYEDTGGPFFDDPNCHKPDEFADDQAVYFMTKQGLAVILGCAHSGVINTLDYITKMTNQKNAYAVVGGMHLINADSNRIERTIDALKKYDVQKIIPLHCTGQNGIDKIQKAFGDKCMLLHAGDKVIF